MATSGPKYAGAAATAGTGQGSWASVNNLVGGDDGLVAVWSKPAATNQASQWIACTGFTFPEIASGDIINSISVSVNSYVANTTRMQGGQVELWIGDKFSGGTQVGTTQPLTSTTSSANVDTDTFAAVSYANLSNLRVYVQARGATAQATASTASFDYVSITVDYTSNAPIPVSDTDSGTGTDAGSVVETDSISDSDSVTGTDDGTYSIPAWPNLVASYKVTATGSTTTTTASFTPAVGELIVVKGGDGANTASTNGVNPNAVTDTQGNSYGAAKITAGYTGGSRSSAAIFAAVTTAATSMTVSLTWTAQGTGEQHVMIVERYTNAKLAATPATNAAVFSSDSAPSSTITTVAANSYVSWIDADYAARDPATKAYRSGAVETQLQYTSTVYTVYAAYQQAASPGSQTYGLTAPSTQQWTLAAIEIQSAGGGGATNKSDSDSGTGTDDDAARSFPSSDSGTGTDSASNLAVTLASSDSGAGTDAVSARAFPDSDSATGTDDGAPVASGGIGTAKIGTMAETSAGTSLNPAWPAGIATGEVAVLFAVTNSYPSATPTGWTQFVTPFAMPEFICGYWHVYTSGDTAPTLSWATSGRGSAQIVAWSGVDNATPLAVTAVTAANNSGSNTGSLPVGPTASAPSGGRAISACAVDASTTATITKPTDMTQLAQSTGTGRRLATADRSLSGAGTVSESWTQSTTNLGIGAWLTVLNPSATGPTNKSDSDTGAGTDAVSARVLPDSDTGAGTDAVNARAFPGSDSGTGTDAATTIAATLSATDSGAGTDAGTIAATLSATDSGAGTDAVAGRTLIGSDSGTGTDTVGQLDQGATPKSASDNGTGTDTVTALTATLSATDSGTGTDAVNARSFPGSDSGTGTDAVANLDQGATPKSDSDTGTATEAVPARTLAAPDTGTATELAAALAFASADAAAGNDAVAALGATLTASDGVTGTDTSGTRTATLTGAESGAGTDAVAALVATLAASDTVSVTDAGTAMDAAGVPKNASDTGRATEAVLTVLPVIVRYGSVSSVGLKGDHAAVGKRYASISKVGTVTISEEAE